MQAKRGKRVAVYLRVSTAEQTTENQARALEAAAAARGWTVAVTYEDAGISGAKGRDRRPQLDAMLRDAVRRRFDVLMVSAVDRLGRSLPDLVATMTELHGAGIDLFVLQQGLDTSTPSGRALFGMLGVFAEFERAMIQERVRAGVARARAQGRRIGRPRATPATERQIAALLSEGVGKVSIAKRLGCGVALVQRVARAAAECPAPA